MSLSSSFFRFFECFHSFNKISIHSFLYFMSKLFGVKSLSHTSKLWSELFKDLLLTILLTMVFSSIALAASNVPDILEDRAGIAWSTENITDIAYGSLSYYNLKTDGYKIMPNWTDAEGDFSGGLVGWWKFDENTGNTTADFSGKGNNGNLTNFNWNTTSGWTDGKYGKALRFDGADDYVSIAPNDVFDLNTNDFTMAGWFWANIVNVGAWTGFCLGQNYLNGVCLNQERMLADDTTAGGGAIILNYDTYAPTGQWNHVVVTHTASTKTFKAYLNGVPNGDQTHTAALDESDHAVYIGRNDLSSYFFNGTIDEVRIYNRALSADEIKLSYEKRKPGYQIAIQNLTVAGKKYTPLGVQNGISYVNRAYNSTAGYVLYYPTTDDFRFSLNGSVVSTNDLIESITYKGSTSASTFASTTPVDSTIKMNSNITSSYGMGSTFIVTKGTKLTKGEVKINMSSPNGTYDTVYQLYSGSDYLINTINTPLNVTRSFAYNLGNNYTGDTFTIPGQALAERCWNRTELSGLYVCSADASQVSSPGIASGLIYDGGNSSFYEACFRNVSTAPNQVTHYQFDITTKDKEDVLIPFVKGTCTDINSKMYLVAQDEKPKAFGTVESKEREGVVGIILKYKNIFINGTDRFPAGDYKLCVKKVAEDTGKRISYVEIRGC